MKIKLALIALVTVLFVSCSSTKTAVAGIVGKHWKLKTLDGKDIAKSENQQKDVYFILIKE